MLQMLQIFSKKTLLRTAHIYVRRKVFLNNKCIDLYVYGR